MGSFERSSDPHNHQTLLRRHTLKISQLDDVNEYIDLLRGGDVVGGAVITF